MALEFKTLQPSEYYKKYFEHKIRPDGRGLWQIRPTAINIGTMRNADSSALVRLGNTAVVCGIKLELAAPKSDEPKKGYLVPNIELSALCASHFRPGPPSEQAQVASQLLNRIMQNSKCIDLDDLCIKEGKLAWVIYCDILCLNYDGTVVDPALIAITAALRNLRLPEVTLDTETNNPKVDFQKKRPVKILSDPVATTFAIFEENIVLADPTYEEEILASGIVNVVTLENGQLCGTYKPGGAGISDVHLQECIEQAHKRQADVRTLVAEALAALS